MVFYPVELNLAGQDVLVVGGGAVAARKVAGLLQAGAKVRVASPEFVPQLQQCDAIRRHTCRYSPELIRAARLVFACTNDPQINQHVAADARKAGAWCNVVDSPAESDFFVPAVLRRGRLAVAVSTGGASPALAAAIRDGLECQFEPEFSMLVEDLNRARAIVREQITDPQLRQQVLATLAGDRCVQLLKTAGQAGWRTFLEQVLRDAGCRFSGFAPAPGPGEQTEF